MKRREGRKEERLYTRLGGEEEEEEGVTEYTADCLGQRSEPMLYSWQWPCTRGPDIRSRNP